MGAGLDQRRHLFGACLRVAAGACARERQLACSPARSSLLDNTGKIGVKKPRPTTGSFEWAGTVAGGATTVTVQVKNLHAFDNAQLNHFTLTVQHNCISCASRCAIRGPAAVSSCLK